MCEGEVALFGNKRLHPTVSQHVGFQIKSFDASVAALVAAVGLVTLLSIIRVHFEVLAVKNISYVWSMAFGN